MNIRVFLCINVEQTWTLKWNRIACITNAQTQKQGSRAQEVTLTWIIRGKTKTTQTCGFRWSVFKLNWRRDVFRICSVGRSVSLSHSSLSMHLEMTELAGVLDFSSVWGGEGTAIGTQPVSLNAFKFIQCLQPVHFFPAIILLFSFWLTTLCLRPYCYKRAEAEFEPRL